MTYLVCESEACSLSLCSLLTYFGNKCAHSVVLGGHDSPGKHAAVLFSSHSIVHWHFLLIQSSQFAPALWTPSFSDIFSYHETVVWCMRLYLFWIWFKDVTHDTKMKDWQRKVLYLALYSLFFKIGDVSFKISRHHGIFAKIFPSLISFLKNIHNLTLVCLYVLRAHMLWVRKGL